MVERLERLIDETVAEHPLPQEFVVPATSVVGAALDVARATCRRAERRAVALQESGAEVNPEATKYLNRSQTCCSSWPDGRRAATRSQAARKTSLDFQA
jgi:cob(I)alamin adenosyltransferase